MSREDFDPTDAVHVGGSFRTARKEHACQCGSPIRKGQRYERQFWMVEGSPEVTKIGDHIHSFEENEDRNSY